MKSKYYLFLFILFLFACGPHEECSCIAKTPRDSIEAVKQCRKDSIEKANNKKEETQTASENPYKDPIIKIEMTLSAFGVESDDFPNIDAELNFVKNKAVCKKYFYNPANKPSIYSLNKNEIKNILELLQKIGPEELKKEYTVQKTDQPSSKMVIYTTKQKFEINDYGLEGEYPLQEIYKIVYKF